jgi:hypothetical protein
MSDIKSVVSVIKILERTIGILENCNDVGGITDSTRKRVIEMLNKATLEIYFLDDLPDDKISKSGIISEKEQTPEISETPEVVEAEDELRYVEDILIEESVPETVPEEELTEVISIEETLTQEEFVEEDEEEGKEDGDENVVENISEENDENVVSEDAIFNRQDNWSDKPLFEWEIDPEPVQKTQEDDINLLKLQLEEERKRLEQELQNWQDERRKRDEEILAAKKLLESLQQQTALNQAKQQTVTQQPQLVVQQPQQPQPVVQQPQQPQPVVRQPQQPQPVVQQPQQPQPVVQQPRQPQPVVQQPQQPQPVVRQPRQPQQPQQSTQSEPLIKREAVKVPVQKEETQETLIDRFIGTKKVLHENFETDNMVNQISTPVASLPRAIGINDRFRFIKELFGGDSDLYNETIKCLDTIGSLVSAIAYIESNFSWDKNSDSVKQLISLIRRRYM